MQRQNGRLMDKSMDRLIKAAEEVQARVNREREIKPKELPPEIDVRRIVREWQCKARIANVGAEFPHDCNWPICGCDPYAEKVIFALEESGIDVYRQATDAKLSAGSPAQPEIACSTWEEEFDEIADAVDLHEGGGTTLDEKGIVKDFIRKLLARESDMVKL